MWVLQLSETLFQPINTMFVAPNISYSFILSLIFAVVLSSPSAGMSMQVSLNSFSLPILTLCNKYPILLDTGSQDSWLAGITCVQCPQKVSICPKNNQEQPVKEIKYFKGSVRGGISLVNTCLGAFKFICATHAQGMQGVGAVGILGLRGQTGRNLLKALIQVNEIQKQAFGIYQGHQETKLLLGEIPNDYVKSQLNVLPMPNEQEWHIKAEGVITCGKQLTNTSNHSIFFDTGSNMLILPPLLYEQIRTLITQQMRRLNCVQSQTLSFSCPYRTKIHETFIIRTSKDSQIRLLLRDMMTIQEETYKYRIEKGATATIVVGGTLMRDYMVSFRLDGGLSVYQTNKELLGQEVMNFKIILLQYALTAVGLAFILQKGYQWAESAINKKIVI